MLASLLNRFQQEKPIKNGTKLALSRGIGGKYEAKKKKNLGKYLG